MYMPGATAVGITYNDGVVFASEKRIAYGNFLVSKSTKKTFPSFRRNKARKILHVFNNQWLLFR